MTIAALTSADTAALEFYQENVAYVDGFGLTNLDRPERLLFKKGRQLMEQALAAAKAPTRELYSDAEVVFLVQTYLASGADMQATRTAYWTRSSPPTPSGRLTSRLLLSAVPWMQNASGSDSFVQQQCAAVPLWGRSPPCI